MFGFETNYIWFDLIVNINVFSTDIQEKLGILNSGVVYAVFDYVAQNNDELHFKTQDKLTILRKGDETEQEWWWAKKANKEGYIPRNLLGVRFKNY